MAKNNLKLTIRSHLAEDTIKLGRTIGANFRGSEVIELIGDIGSGKTTLVKGLAKGAGSKELVISPSFTISNEYQAPKFKIYHFDFYRLSDPGIIRRYLAEVIEVKSDVIIIEWPAVIDNILPINRLTITIIPTISTSRQITINYPNSLDYLMGGLI